MAKPKIALYWCASCGGCEETILDLDEALLDVVAQVELVFWPVAMDFKYSDLEALPDGDIAVAFINGAIRTSEQEAIAKLLRRKSATVVAFGACAISGGIPALANLTSKRAIFDRAYLSAPSVDNDAGVLPVERSETDGIALELPAFHETVQKLDDVVEVDYYLPGCPPPASLVGDALQAVLSGQLPEKGAFLAPSVALCTSCDRNATKPDELCIDQIKRVVDAPIDPDRCILAQGLLCMGPVTRDGCGQACINGNMPCTGCFGPPDGCRDQGGKMVSTLGGVITGEDGDAVARAIAALVDPAGTFYRYTVSASLLGQRREGDA